MTKAQTSTTATTTAAVLLGDPVRGAQIFNKNCANCHGQGGVGSRTGPSLKHEKARKNYRALITWIENPKPPIHKRYLSPLGLKDVKDVAAYIETL